MECFGGSVTTAFYQHSIKTGLLQLNLEARQEIGSASNHFRGIKSNFSRFLKRITLLEEPNNKKHP